MEEFEQGCGSILHQISKEQQELAIRLLKKVEKAGDRGLTAEEIGKELMGVAEDILSDHGWIKWVMKRFWLRSNGTVGDEIDPRVHTTIGDPVVWAKLCVLTNDGKRLYERINKNA